MHFMLPACAYLLTQAEFVQVLATECEIEEEYLVNNLQKRIGKLHQEKTQLEQSLGVLQRKVISNARLNHTIRSSRNTASRVLHSCRLSGGSSHASSTSQAFHCCSMQVTLSFNRTQQEHILIMLRCEFCYGGL